MTGRRGPSPSVVLAFGGRGPAVRLPGGQGTSWRAGPVVLKPVGGAEDERTVRWLHAAARAVEGSALRLATPLAAADGRVAVDGWTATSWLPGERATGDWRVRAGVARQLAQAFAPVDARTLPRRTDPWAVADRVAWGEEPGPAVPHPLAGALPAARPTTSGTVVHGDLAGNVLVHPSQPPAVLDLSLYVRPVEWSVAVLAVDVVTFEGVPTADLGAGSEDPSFPELVARAAVFRMTTDVLRGRAPDPRYRAVADWALARL